LRRLLLIMRARPFNVSIFILCWNQEVMLPKTWAFYRTLFPAAHMYLIDDLSTDRSVEVARMLGMTVLDFARKPAAYGVDRDGLNLSTGIRRFPLPNILQNGPHNAVWRHVVEPGTWVITIDADELVCIDEANLAREDASGSTILTTSGWHLVANSNRKDLSDLDFWDIVRGYHDRMFNKQVVFKAGPGAIDRINYGQGSHWCAPNGTVHRSKFVYKLFHAGHLGVAYAEEKFAAYRRRFVEPKVSRNLGPLYYLHHNASKLYKTAVHRAMKTIPMVLQTRAPSDQDRAHASRITTKIALCVPKHSEAVRDPSLESQAHTVMGQQLRKLLGPTSPPSGALPQFDVHLNPLLSGARPEGS
jgi:hypothetical protein